jgi:hypothetical protein
MSIQRGLGHWKIAPIKQLRSAYLPEALHLLDRREVYKTNQKINVPLFGDTAFRAGCDGKGTAASPIKKRRGFRAFLFGLVCGVGYLT